MEFVKLLSTRRSVRKYGREPVDERDIEAILEAAAAAPSAGNVQPFRMIVVTDVKVKEALSKAALNQRFVAEAAALFCFVEDPEASAARYGERGRELYTRQDTAIACAFAHLRAADLGLGSVWVGAFDDEAVDRILGLAPPLGCRAILCVGHGAERPGPRRRKRVSELVMKRV